MSKFSSRLLAASAAVAVAAGFSYSAQAQEFTRQITFGDSLSDGGRYAAFVPTEGRFTTNPDPVWVEVMAAQFGLELTSVAVGGLNFAEGGARVTAPQPIPPFTQLEISSQINNFFAGGGTLGAGDLVTIQGGGNDLFALQDGRATVDEFIDAAVSLGGLTQSLVDAGAGTVLIGNLQLTDPYNQALDATLASLGTNALYLDVDQLFLEVLADPAAFGFVNVTDIACTNGSALTCTPADLVTPDANLTYALADSVHPGGRLQAIQGNMAAAALRAPSQIGQLSYVAENVLMHTQSLASAQMRQGGEGDNGSRVFGGVSIANIEIDGGAPGAGLENDSTVITAGFDSSVSQNVGFGAAVSFIDGDGDFSAATGAYETSGFLITGYVRGQHDAIRWGGQLNFGEMEFDDITRTVQLGELMRTNVGSTDGDVLSFAGEAAWDAALADWFLGPVGGLSFNKIEIGGYTDGDNSTAFRFGGQTLETYRAFLGAEFSGSAGGFEPYLRAVYSMDLKDDERTITVTPDEAPISFKTDALTLEPDVFDVRAGLGVTLADSIRLDVNAGGVFGRDDADAYDANITLSVPF
ncbi:MAG: autotransporter domain-containing protein [Pseudomonadota bacterium]